MNFIIAISLGLTLFNRGAAFCCHRTAISDLGHFHSRNELSAVRTAHNLGMAFDTFVKVRSRFEAQCPLKHDKGNSLANYMQLPVDQYVCIKMPLDATLERFKDQETTNRFNLTVPPVKFFHLSVSPMLFCTVSQSDESVVIESTECILRGSPYVVSLNGCYKFSVRTEFNWVDTPSYKSIKSNSCIDVIVDPPKPFKYFGKKVLESTGTLAMKIALRQIENAFVLALTEDYQRWSTDAQYRHARAGNMCIANPLTTASANNATLVHVQQHTQLDEHQPELLSSSGGTYSQPDKAVLPETSTNSHGDLAESESESESEFKFVNKVESAATEECDSDGSDGHGHVVSGTGDNPGGNNAGERAFGPKVEAETSSSISLDASRTSSATSVGDNSLASNLSYFTLYEDNSNHFAVHSLAQENFQQRDPEIILEQSSITADGGKCTEDSDINTGEAYFSPIAPSPCRSLFTSAVNTKSWHFEPSVAVLGLASSGSTVIPSFPIHKLSALNGFDRTILMPTDATTTTTTTTTTIATKSSATWKGRQVDLVQAATTIATKSSATWKGRQVDLDQAEFKAVGRSPRQWWGWRRSRGQGHGQDRWQCRRARSPQKVGAVGRVWNWLFRGSQQKQQRPTAHSRHQL